MARWVGLDIGTSGAKALAINERGDILAQATRTYPLSTPQPLWSEQDPTDWQCAAEECLEEVHSDRAEAIGLTGQMHGSVFLDAEGEVIRPALLWNDQRTVAECAAIESQIGRDRLLAITGNPMLPGFQLPKLIWLRNHEPEAFARVHQVLLPKDFVRFRLTGERFTDVADASGVGLLDIRTRRWSEDLIKELELDASWFPDVVESRAQTGTTKSGVPVVAGAGDQGAAAVGMGAIEPGVGMMSLGTSGVVFAPLASADFPAASPDPRDEGAHLFCHANGSWLGMGVMLACGSSVKWAHDLLFACDSDYAQWESETAAVSPGAEGLAYLPYLSGERCPFVAPNATGCWTGLRLGHSRGHLARAVMEGIAFNLEQVKHVVEGMGAHPEVFRLCGGGARSGLWRQMLADIVGVRIQQTRTDEGPAFGAAILAGVGAGGWPSLEAACAETVHVVGEVVPGTADYRAARGRFVATQRQVGLSIR